VYGSESLSQTLRQLEAYGRDGLPVLSGDGQQVQGWITNASVLRRVADEIGESRADRPVRHAPTVDQSARPGATPAPEPPALPGYQVFEVYLSADSPAVGRFLTDVR